MKSERAVLSVRMSKDEKKQIEARAAKLGLTVKELLTQPPSNEGLEAMERRLREVVRQDLETALSKFKTETTARDEAFRKDLIQFFKSVYA